MPGLCFGRLIGRKAIAIIAAILFFVLYLLTQFSFWWFNPSFRLINHLWVLISGDLIEGQQLDSASISFRLATSLFGLALLFLGLIVFRNKERQGLKAAKSVSLGFVAIALTTFVCACYLHFTSLDELMLDRRVLAQKL